MKLKNSMLVVRDIDLSVEFYKTVLGLKVMMDFGGIMQKYILKKMTLMGLQRNSKSVMLNMCIR